MLDCNNCGDPMEWGSEYQLDHGTDEDCLCSECYHSQE